jgi:putative molybdopterin biosynthesis protein
LETYLTPADVAQLMGVTRETVYSMICRGQLEAYKFGRSRRITHDQITRCLNSRYERAIDATKPNA